MNNPARGRRPRALPMRERIRIGRALHEGVAQELAAATFLLASVAPHVRAHRESAHLDIGRVQAILERNIRSLCQLAHAIAAESVEPPSPPTPDRRTSPSKTKDRPTSPRRY